MRNLIFIFILFFSCATTSKVSTEKEVMDSWLQRSKSELMATWGIPTRTSDDGLGGEILSYESTKVFPQMGMASIHYNNVYHTSSQNVVTRSRMFYVNKDGIIYSWLCNGRRGY